MKCPTCKGTGKVRNPDAGNCESPWSECPKCKGTCALPTNEGKTVEGCHAYDELIQPRDGYNDNALRPY